MATTGHLISANDKLQAAHTALLGLIEAVRLERLLNDGGLYVKNMEAYSNAIGTATKIKSAVDEFLSLIDRQP